MKYWEDGSYGEVSESTATKVWYGSCWTWDSYLGWDNPYDHSAVRITSGSNAGKYESKWGAWPRYIHPAEKCPYPISNRKYYIKTPTSITGPNLICSGSSQTFSASNWQSGFYWDKSSNLNLSSPTTNSTVTVSANGTGAAYLYVKNSNGATIATHHVLVGVPLQRSSLNTPLTTSACTTVWASCCGKRKPKMTRLSSM